MGIYLLFGQKGREDLEATWSFLFQELLPNILRDQCCGSANDWIYVNYTFRDQGNDHWVTLRTRWTHCEPKGPYWSFSFLGVNFNMDPMSKNAWQVCMFPSPWWMITQVNGHGCHWGKTEEMIAIIFAMAIQGPFFWRPDLSISWWVPGLTTDSGLQTRRGITFYWGQLPSASWAFIHNSFWLYRLSNTDISCPSIVSIGTMFY